MRMSQDDKRLPRRSKLRGVMVAVVIVLGVILVVNQARRPGPQAIAAFQGSENPLVLTYTEDSCLALGPLARTYKSAAEVFVRPRGSLSLVEQDQAMVAGENIYYLVRPQDRSVDDSTRWELLKISIGSSVPEKVWSGRGRSPGISRQFLYWMKPLRGSYGVMQRPLFGGAERELGRSPSPELTVGLSGASWYTRDSGADSKVSFFRDLDGHTYPLSTHRRPGEIVDTGRLLIWIDGSELRIGSSPGWPETLGPVVALPLTHSSSGISLSRLTWHKETLYCLAVESTPAGLSTSLLLARVDEPRFFRKVVHLRDDLIHSPVFAGDYLYYWANAYQEKWFDFSRAGLRRKRSPTLYRVKLPQVSVAH